MPSKKGTKVKLAEQKRSNDQHTTTDPSRKAIETSFSGADELFDDDPAQERHEASDSSKPKRDKWKFLKTKKNKSKHQQPKEIIPSPQSEEGNKKKYHVASPSSGVPSEIEQHENESLVGISTLSESPPRPSANRVPFLECYSRPVEEQLSPVDQSAHTDLLSRCLSEDEEEGRIMGVKKPPDITGMERAAQRSRDSSAKFLPRINKIRDDLSSTKQKLEQKQSALEDLLSSKESAFDILRKKVDQQNIGVVTLNEEVESLSKQLNTKCKDYNDLQVKYDRLCQQRKQPEVLTDAAHKLPTLTTCELTDLRSLLDTKSHDKPSTEATNQEQQSPQDNRTDAEKLQDEIEELKRNAKHDIGAHQQKIEELQAQKETLSHQLSNLLASNLHLKEVIKTAIEEAPLSADGIESGDEGKTDKLLIQIRAKYLEQSVQIVEFQEVYQKQNAELAQCKAKLNEWQERYSHKKKELEEKVKERDLQLKEQRQSNAPPTSRLDHFETDCVCKDPEHETDLKATLKKKDEEIQTLTIQLQAFLEVSSQRQKLHEHSKTQSTVVVQLRKDLEAAHQELEAVRSKSESAKTIDALYKEIIQVNEELRDLKLAKNVVEDELDILKKECEASEKAHQSTRHELAQSLSSIASLRAVQEKGKATLVADEGCDLTEMNILRVQARLYQIEVEELQRKEKIYKVNLSELGKSKMVQERKLKDLQGEQDLLAQQNMHLLATQQTNKGQLDKFGDVKTQVEVTQEQISALTETIVAKTEEIEALEMKVKGLEDELEAIKFQAFQYEQDFEEERQARADAVGARDSDYGKFSQQVQSLTEQLEQAKSETEIERKEKQAVISKLEVNFATSQRLNRQLEQAERDFNQALEAKSEELKNEKSDNTLLKASLTKLQEQNTELKSRIVKLQEQLQRAETTYLKRQGELLQQMNDLKLETGHCQTELQEKVQKSAAQNLILLEQLEKVTQELKAKETKLDKLSTEKCLIEEMLDKKVKGVAILAEELSATKASQNQIARTLEQSREALDAALADSAHLQDEIIAKTSLVKQYQEQTNSFKAKLAEANGMLLKAQCEFQQCQNLVSKPVEEWQLGEESAESKQADHFTGLLLEGEQWLRKVANERETMHFDLQQKLSAMKKCLEQKQIELTQAVCYMKNLTNHFQKQFPQNVQNCPTLSYGRDALKSHILNPRSPFQFTKRIGSGSYGSIYAIEYNGSPCIAKRLLDILMGRGGYQAVSEEGKRKFHEAFVRECILLSQMNHHNIVQFIGVFYGKEQYDLTLILERLEMDLDKYLQPSKIIPLAIKVKILSDISCGLQYLHERSVVHRDLSAANILLTSDLKAKIADLGVSKIVDVRVTRHTITPGTQAYMSPEALEDGSYDSSLDIFSFGVIALYTAIQEFPEVSHARVPDAVSARGEGEIMKRQKWIDLMSGKQPELSVLVLWCLSDDPSDRPTSNTLCVLLHSNSHA